MPDKHQFFAKIIIAQVSAFVISSYLLQHVFVGPTPMFRVEVKDTIRALPSKVAVTVKSIPQTVMIAYRTITQKPHTGQVPPPWVSEPGPIAQNPVQPTIGNQAPQPTAVPQNPITTLFPTLFPTQLPQPTVIVSRPRLTEQPVSTVNPPPPPPAKTASLETQTIAEINKRRKDVGLPVVTVNAQLTAAARRHSADISSRRVCGHTGSDNSDPFKRARQAGFLGQIYGETVSCGARTPQAAVNGWWSSPPHHAILTNSGIKQIGLGWVNNYQTAVVGY